VRIEIYTRPGCHLCDEALAELQDATSRFDFELVQRDVQENPEWEAEFGLEVPVIFIDGRKAFKYRIPPGELRKRLSRPTKSSL
jgi:glutaredoxin